MKSLLALLFISVSAMASPDDLALMNQARVKFEQQKFDQALTLYSQVPKSSDYWLQSLEEKAWTYIRQNKFEKALAQYHTLTTPAFSAQVGPETYLIGSFAALKICDYKSIFDVFKDFKSKYKDLSKDLQQLAKTGDSPAVWKAVDKLKTNPQSTWASLGADVQKLPQFLNRDKVLQSAINSGSKVKITSRIKVLADRDLKDLAKIVQKLHIVEVEAIQRMNLTQTKVPTIARDAEAEDDDTIEFPKEQEVWLDEVDKYHVNAKGCQTQRTKQI